MHGAGLLIDNLALHVLQVQLTRNFTASTDRAQASHLLSSSTRTPPVSHSTHLSLLGTVLVKLVLLSSQPPFEAVEASSGFTTQNIEGNSPRDAAFVPLAVEIPNSSSISRCNSKTLDSSAQRVPFETPGSDFTLVTCPLLRGQ